MVVIAAYLAGLLAITARQPPASRAAVVIGTGTGVLLGLAVYALRPMDNPVHITNAWLAALFEITKVAAVPAVFAAAITAVIAAARRTSRRERDGTLPLTQIKARQGVAAGLCVGVTCALLVSVLGITTIAIAPHAASSIQWTMPGGDLPGQLAVPIRGGRQPRRRRLPADPHHLPVPRGRYRRVGRSLRGRQQRPAAWRRGRRRYEAAPAEDTARPAGGLELDNAPRPGTVSAASLLSLPEWDPATGGPRSPAR